ncbi:MAG: hypothetical protein CMH64_01345 [Nanoarchaeota archaeon]|nr:hypothetical protein [Nanoarchaeota archaeon]|tara:strand:- start:2031 stop:2297 length:267 start_codon:yes stop_codon:yes gene_type:complete
MLFPGLAIHVVHLTELEESIRRGLDECSSTFSSTPMDKINWPYIDIVQARISREISSYSGEFSDYFKRQLENLEGEKRGILDYDYGEA